MFRVPEALRASRAKAGSLYTTAERAGNNGLFLIPAGLRRPHELRCYASDALSWHAAMLPPPPWEHVSVSTAARIPTWEEMCFVKNLFWSPEDVVLQFHPRASEYVNDHPRCLHLWRPIGVELPTPPPQTVGRHPDHPGAIAVLLRP